MGVIFMEEKISSGRLHRLVLSDRHTGSVTGVNDVVSFDENEIVLDTDMGLLTVRGKELHVKHENKLVLTINRQPIGEWFKEQWEKLRQGLRQSTEEPRKSRGFRM